MVQMDESGSRFPPTDVRKQSAFFIVYFEPKYPLVKIQLDDQRSYEIWAEDFGRCPQIMRLELWEQCLRLACENGQALYLFGETEADDKIESIRMTEQKQHENIARGLRSNAIQTSRVALAGKRGYQSPWNHPAVRHPQR